MSEEPRPPTPSLLFREDALRHRAGRLEHGTVLELSNAWARWSSAFLLALPPVLLLYGGLTRYSRYLAAPAVLLAAAPVPPGPGPGAEAAPARGLELAAVLPPQARAALRPGAAVALVWGGQAVEATVETVAGEAASLSADQRCALRARAARQDASADAPLLTVRVTAASAAPLSAPPAALELRILLGREPLAFALFPDLKGAWNRALAR